MNSALKTQGLRFDLSYPALNLDVADRSLAFVLGVTGSGKSELLLTLAGINKPKAGDVEVLGQDPFAGSEKEWLSRRPDIGYVLPTRTLVSHLTVLQNIMLPLTYHRLAEPKEAAEIAHTMMAWLGIKSDAQDLPAVCHESERRIITLARALVLKPKILFVDQAFAHLDAKMRQQFIKMYGTLLDELGISMILASKDMLAVASLAENLSCPQTFVFLAEQDIICIDSWKSLAENDNPEIQAYLQMHFPKTSLNP